MYSIRGIKLLPPAVRAERRIACGEFSLAHGAHLVALQKKRRGPTHAALCWSGNSGGGGSGGNGGGDGGNGGGEDGDERPGGPLGFVALVSLAAVAGLTAAPAGKTEAAAVAANQDDPEEEPTRLSIEQLTCLPFPLLSCFPLRPPSHPIPCVSISLSSPSPFPPLFLLCLIRSFRHPSPFMYRSGLKSPHNMILQGVGLKPASVSSHQSCLSPTYLWLTAVSPGDAQATES